ncbi:MAG TPA: putative sugar nucleotidyl transferase, partial [Gemmatimonadaceae bacterium]|nr:putative sugar nucleotidyl transferase [Gemmatimonadaceae bacterium]
MTADRPGFVLVDDDVARGFEPFALTRPVGELRAGGALMRHRWIQALAMPCIGFIAGPHLDAFAEFDSAPVASAVLPSGTVLVNARCAPALGGVVAHTPDVWRCGGRVAAVRLSEPLDTAALRADGAAAAAAFENVRVEGATTELDGWWLDAVWDLIGHLSEMLQADAIALMPTTGAQVPATLTVLGGHPVHVEAGATIEPFVVADASAGAVLIRRGAHVHAFTRLVGPCIIGEEVVVLGGRIAACSIGERVK